MYALDPSFSQSEWNEYLQANNRATVYHTLEWRSILEDVFRYKTRYSVCRDASGAVVGILPLALLKSWITGNRVVSLPFSQYGGPLVADNLTLERVVKDLKGYLGEYHYVRLRARDPIDSMTSRRLGLQLSTYYSRCVVPLANRTLKDVWESLHKNSVRRAVKRAEDCGIVVDIWDGQTDTDRLTDLMFQTCKRHGVPPYPPCLLEAISELLVRKNAARIYVARLGGQIVAALVLFFMSKETVYAYNFSDDKYLRFDPNNALLWTAIKWSWENGLHCFDLGICSPQDNQLLSFKMRWGATVTKLHEYFLAPAGKVISPDRRASLKYRSASFAWRFLLPTFIASTIGPRLLSHLE